VRLKGSLVRFLATAVVLGAIASPPPALTDRDTYVTLGRQLIVPDCGDVTCARVLAGARRLAAGDLRTPRPGRTRR
jgi:hypothetical protein